MEILNETKWVIMDKDRTVIAKGVPRNRYLIPVADKEDKKRVIYYSSKKKAEAGFSNGLGFYNDFDYETRKNKYELEAVEVQIIIKAKG